MFFLLTSQFVINTGVKVKLPASKTNEQTTPSRLVVSITPEGKVYLGSKLTELSTLSGALDDVKTKSGENNLIIRADKKVEIDLVIRVIDAAKSIGIDRFTIETEKESF
ncbi:biopolymer transport protein ExbD [bacterium BMS3Abin04]|nr:biopolymer transport protein ExbD [bacterium BMS3Abin04]